MNITTNSVKTIESGTLVAHIVPDDDVVNPRKEGLGSLGTFVGGHHRYTYHDIDGPDMDDLEKYRAKGAESPLQALEMWAVEEYGAIAVLPVYMLDHSGVAFSTTPFNDSWDSGLYGIIFATEESKAEFCEADVTHEQLLEYLKSEVETLDLYARGEVYGVIVTPADDPSKEISSCWGFYGYDYAVGDATRQVISDAEAILAHENEKLGAEAAEAAYWAARGVETVAS